MWKQTECRAIYCEKCGKVQENTLNTLMEKCDCGGDNWTGWQVYGTMPDGVKFKCFKMDKKVSDVLNGRL